MKITSRQDIEAPVAFVYDALKDFDYWERAALRHGADVTRTNGAQATGPGLGWLIRFPFRGKDRKLTLRVVSLDAPGQLVFAGSGGSFDGTAVVDLLELGAKRTRLSMTTEVKPQGLAARLVLQTIKLARGRMQGRVDKRVAAIAMEIEERFRTSTRRMGR
jgi:carbon monoxide dehydrogenase subunit G